MFVRESEGTKDLQRVLDSSLATASPLARRIYANQRWSPASVQRFVNRVMAATVATVQADGRPHAAVVLVACGEGSIYFTASRGSRLLRNLRHRPQIAMTVTDRDHDLTLFGEAVSLGPAGDLPDLVRRLDQRSRRGQFIPQGWDGFLYEVHIDRIFLSR
jgi:hypothetical protein